MKVKLIIIIIFSMALSNLIAAELPSHPLTFKDWKRVQVHDSTTGVVKLSNEISALTTLQSDPANSSEENQQKLTRALEKKKLEQKSKLENLQYSKQLDFEDYFDVYLSKFSGDEKALAYIAKRLSKTSVAYLLQKSMSKKEGSKTIIGEEKSLKTPTSKN